MVHQGKQVKNEEICRYAKENLKPKELWHTLSVRHSSLGFSAFRFATLHCSWSEIQLLEA